MGAGVGTFSSAILSAQGYQQRQADMTYILVLDENIDMLRLIIVRLRQRWSRKSDENIQVNKSRIGVLRNPTEIMNQGWRLGGGLQMVKDMVDLLTPEQIFWSNDLIKMKAKALNEQSTASRPIKPLTVYPPNTPTTLVPRVLPTKNKMADENVPAPAPIKSDDQILPFAAWNTNFFRAFTASASVPAIYIQQFWNTLTYEAKIGVYSIELDESQFVLDANLPREALDITPVDQAYQFVSPLSGEAIMDLVNELGYTEVIHFMSRMAVNNLSQPWRAILSMINQCLTGKTSGHDRPKIHNIHQRSTSPFHLAEEDLRLGNLKFIPKGEEDEVFRMLVPNELILNNIRNAPYYNAYLEMVAKHDQKVAAEKEGKKKYASTKQPKPKPAIEKSSKPTPAPKPMVTKEKPSKASTAKPPKPKPAKEKSTKATPLQKAIKGKVTKVRNVKSSFQLVDKPDEEPAHSEPKPEPEQEGAVEEYDMEHAIQMKAIRPLHVVEGKGKAIIAEELGEDVTNQVNLEEKTAELDEDQAGPEFGISRALAGPDPKPPHDEFMAYLYPKVQESLKFLADEHVILEDPLSSTGTLSSMKNLEDAYAIGDQFINDKSTNNEPGKLNVEAEVASMVIVPIYQASSSIPPLSTPVIDLSPPKPASSTTQIPIFTATTTTTKTPLPPPLQQQSTTKSELAKRVAALEKKLLDLEQNNKNLDNTTRNLGSRVYTLELRDLPHKINEAVYENVKEAVQISTGSPSRPLKRLIRRRYERNASPKDPIPNDERPATPEPAWVIPTSHIPNVVNNGANALATTIDISKPLPLSGPPGHVTIQTQFFFNKDLDYLHYGSKGSGQPFSIFKMKAARYHDFGLELLVPKHMWIDDVCTYDISASYAYSRYGYDYLKEIILRRADHQEYTIAKYDFKNLYHSDFKDLNLLLLQGHLNHLPDSDIRFEFKHDYTIIDSPHAVMFPISNNERKIMQFNEIYKFSDGTMTNIMEALDYRVKEYKVNQLNSGKLGYSDVHTLEDPTLILEILSRRFFLRLNLPDHRSVLMGSGGMSMSVQLSQAQDDERPQVDDQRLDLADDLKEPQDHISHSITRHMTKITTSKYKILREESKTTS
ncbi:hypothetical protein Tco_0954943 [Tanacetum coccineum]|uniref:Histone deacetylase 14 n=1 Tax=Tanacetum coccineum TaxID=301880 RepID=A0ABQ5E5V4_9ASTR